MPWTEPRVWRGHAQHGDDADKFGESGGTNRYSLNVQWRDNLRETMPAKAVAQGDVFIATGANALERLAVGSNGQALRVNAAGDGVEWTASDVTTGVLYPTTTEFDLVQGGTTGSPERLGVPNDQPKLLTAHGVSAKLTWEDV